MRLFPSSELKHFIKYLLDKDQPLLGSARAVLALRQDLSPGGFLTCFINCREEDNAM